MNYQFHFKPVDASTKSLIERWTSQPHIQQWLHGEGLQNTLKDIDLFVSEKEAFFQHWLAYDGETPFGYLITSPVDKDPENEDSLIEWCREKEGETITLDLMIGNTNYLGRGLSHIMITEFLLQQFPHVKEVLIDPEMTNTRAIHVYKKTGFQVLGEYTPSWHPVPHYMMGMSMNQLKHREGILR